MTGRRRHATLTTVAGAGAPSGVFETRLRREITMALAGDPSNIAPAVLDVAGDGVHGTALWTSDGTEAATCSDRRFEPPDGRTFADPAPASVAVGPGICVAIRSGRRVVANEQRTLSSILADRRDVERRLEDAHAAGDAAEVARLGVEAASFADEYREAFESALALYADREAGRLPRSQLNESPQAVCFPRDDHAFAERVETLLDGSHPEGPFAAAVQALLRETYPLAVISPRHELAAIDGRRVWYAFRDGSVVPAADADTS